MKLLTFPLVFLLLLAGCSDPSGPTVGELKQDNGIFKNADGSPYTGEINGPHPTEVNKTVVGKMKDGLWEGKVEIYDLDMDGNKYLKLVRNYKNGKDDGVTTKYRADGSKLLEQHFAQGEIKCMTTYDETGEVKSDTCK